MSGCPGGYEDDSDYDDFMYVEKETSQEPEVSQPPEKPVCVSSRFGLSRAVTNNNNNFSVICENNSVPKVVPKKKKNKRTNAIPPEIMEKMGSVDSCFQKVLHSLQNNQTNQRILLSELAVCWKQCPQPFQSCLSVLIHTNNLKYGLRNKFHNILLNSLNDYKQKNPTIPGPSNAFKKNLFTFLLTSNFIPDFNKVIHSFELIYCSNGKFTNRDTSSCDAEFKESKEEAVSDENLKNYIFESIHQLVTIKNYLKASRFITSMQLHEKFPSNEICMGLLMQGYPGDLEKYLKDKRDLQISLIEFIDQLIKDLPGSLDKLIPELGVVKMDIANEKAISKFAVKIIKLFSIPESHCPNIVNMQVKKAIKYLVVKRFILKEMACEEWEDLVSAIVEDKLAFQLYLVTSLSDVYELEVAACMAVKYKIPREQLGQDIAIYLADAQKQNPEKACMNESKSSYKLYHDFKLDPNKAIIWVDNVEGFDDCINQLMQNKIIGFDSEWRPSFTSINNKTELSIFQLAADDKVFILDMLKLLKMDVKKWEHFFWSIFLNSQLTVIAYGMREDLLVMSRCMPSLSHLISNLNTFDLEPIHAKLVEESVMGGMPAKSMSSGHKGLSDMVRRLFGVPLEKSQQISDWLRRPLRRKQLIYAALDAHCLLEIYERLLLKYPHLLNYQQKTIKKELKTKEESTRVSYPIILEDSKSSKLEDGSDVAFVCDNMLIGLGTALRKCGINVAILKYTDEHHKALELSNNEDRIILTNGNPYQKLKSGLKDSTKIYNVKSVKKEDQLLEVLTHFGIKVDPSNIFKRCLVCNYDNYVVLNKDEMRYLWAVKRSSMGMSVPENFKYLQVNEKGRVVDNYRKDFAFEQLVEDEEDYDKDDDFDYINNAKTDLKSLPLKKASMRIKTRGFDDVDHKTATIKETAVTIHCEHLNMNKLNNVEKFCVCAGCGKVYWVGLHHRKAHGSLIRVFSET